MLNYIGPKSGQGIQIYAGTLEGRDNTTSSWSYSVGDGRIFLGRMFVDDDDYYAGVDVDELLFFNERLTDQNIQDLN